MSTDEIDEYHRHELMDRLHCIQEMFNSLVWEHPASDLIHNEAQSVSESLSRAYQSAGLHRFGK